MKLLLLGISYSGKYISNSYFNKIKFTFDNHWIEKINSVLQKWPKYRGLLEFIKNEATLQEIQVVLQFFQTYCGTKKYLGYLKESMVATPLHHALKLQDDATKKLIIRILRKTLKIK